MIKLKLIKSSGSCSALHLSVVVAPLYFKNCSYSGSAAAFLGMLGVAVAPLHFKVALPSSEYIFIT